jgi:hypothetical protein
MLYRIGIMSIGRFTPLWRLRVVALTGYGKRYDDDCLISLSSFASFREWIMWYSDRRGVGIRSTSVVLEK